MADDTTFKVMRPSPDAPEPVTTGAVRTGAAWAEVPTRRPAGTPPSTDIASSVSASENAHPRTPKGRLAPKLGHTRIALDMSDPRAFVWTLSYRHRNAFAERDVLAYRGGRPRCAQQGFGAGPE